MTSETSIASSPLADGLAEIFAQELAEQLQRVIALWPRAAAVATRAAACGDMARVFHTIKGGAGLAGRADVANAARALERFFADPDPAGVPAQSALDTLFALASQPAPRLEPLCRALLNDSAGAAAQLLVPAVVHDAYLAVPLLSISRALCIDPTEPRTIGVELAGARLPAYDVADALGVPRPRPRAPPRVGGAPPAVVGESVSAPSLLIVEPAHRLLSLHPWLTGTAIDRQGRLLLVLDSDRMLAQLAAPTSGGDRAVRTAAAADVLVVDDSLVAREAAAMALRGAGMSVDVARDGREALAKLECSTYAVVLSDLEMPQLDGFALIECLRSSPNQSLRDQPVVVCSSRLDVAARQRLDALAVSGFIAKPFTAAELLAAVRPPSGCHKPVAL